MKRLRFMCVLTLVISLLISLHVSADSGEGEKPEPVWKMTVVETSEETVIKRAFNGSIIKLKDNRLLLSFDDYTDVEDWDPGVISGKISEDGGRTWGEKFLIQENIGEKNVANAGITRLKSGALILLFGKRDEDAQISVYMKRSFDEGLTWEEPKNITPYSGHHAPANDRVVVLSSGRVILPLGGDTDALPGETGVFSVYSDDEGESWELGSFVNFGDLTADAVACEPVVVELKDKRVMMLIRTTLGFIYKAYSEDEGTTWGEPIKMDLASPFAPHMIKRIPNNNGDHLLLIWNNNPTSQTRVPLTMAISKDEGETWENFINLAETGVVNAYPSIATYGDEVLITYYIYKPGTGGTYTLPLMLQIWKMSDILGEDYLINDFVIKNTSISTNSGGITVNATIERNENSIFEGNPTVIFQLMKKGTEADSPVSLIAMKGSMQDTADFAAQFASYSGSDYYVKVMVWDKLDNDVGSIGINLAEPKIVLQN